MPESDIMASRDPSSFIKAAEIWLPDGDVLKSGGGDYGALQAQVGPVGEEDLVRFANQPAWRRGRREALAREAQHRLDALTAHGRGGRPQRQHESEEAGLLDGDERLRGDGGQADEAEALGWIATPVIRLSPWASTLASFFRPSDRHTLNLPLQLPVTRSSPQVDTQQSEMGLSSPNSLQSSATSLAHAASSALDLLAASLPTSAFATLRRSLALFSDAVATFRRCSSSAAVPSV